MQQLRMVVSCIQSAGVRRKGMRYNLQVKTWNFWLYIPTDMVFSKRPSKSIVFGLLGPRVYICCQWMTFLPNMSCLGHRAFVTFSYTAFLERKIFEMVTRMIWVRLFIELQENSDKKWCYLSTTFLYIISNTAISLAKIHFWQFIYCHFDFHTCQALLSICQTERCQSLLLQQQIEFLKHRCFLIWYSNKKTWNSPLILIPWNFWYWYILSAKKTPT